MTPENERDGRPDPAPTAEHRTSARDGLGLVHLAICVGIGVALIVAINLFGWLT